MKRIVILSISLMLFTCTTLIGQSSNPTATCSADTGITIDPQTPLSPVYDLDFSANDWTPSQAQQAANRLDEKSELISIQVNYTEKKLEITLDLSNPSTNGWNVAEWNTHLATIL